MIRLPIEEFSHRGAPRPEILLDLAEEGGEVVLTVELEPGEACPSFNRPNADLDTYLEQVDEHIVGVPALLVAEIHRLRGLLEDARKADSITRRLTAPEARELAAMLRHYAEEVGSWR